MLFSSLFMHDPKLVNLPAGKALFREGEPGTVMYVLVEGAADISVRGHVVEQARPGTIVGELAVIDAGGSRTATVTATADCTWAQIDEKRFRFMVAETPHFALEVMRVMAHRLRSADEQYA